MYTLRALCFITALVAVATALPAYASPVSYVADLQTTKSNPVTNILILEAERSGIVHATIYGSDVIGDGMAVIRHDPDFTPVGNRIQIA